MLVIFTVIKNLKSAYKDGYDEGYQDAKGKYDNSDDYDYDYNRE